MSIDTVVCDVWSNNIRSVMSRVSDCIETNQYNYISVDITYPGIVAKPISNQHSYYDLIRCNVDQTNIIQIGLSLFNGLGETPEQFRRIQFNFKFDLDSDLFNEQTINSMLENGFPFDKHKTDGIDVDLFAEEMYNFGLVLHSERNKWLSFDGGFDFAHLLKILKNQALPQTQHEFIDEIQLYFCNTFDIKYIIDSYLPNLGSFDVKNMADALGLERNPITGKSFLVGNAFFKIRERIDCNSEQLDETLYNSQFYGFNSNRVHQNNNGYYYSRI